MKSKKSDVHHDPAQQEYVEGSQESQSTNRSCIEPIETQPCNVSSKLKYLSQFHVFLHRYIDDIVDVEDDGNYGFRAISTLLG